MKAFVIDGKRRGSVRDVPDPVIKDGEVLVRVKASGICGTDVHVYEGEIPLAVPPVIPGHEFAGVIEQVGAGVTDLSTGDRVAIEPNLFCGHCHFCRNARKHFCQNWAAVGLTRNGGFSELAAVPRQAIYPIDKHLSFGHAAFFEPVACVLHGIERSGVKAGDTVAVLGAGSIGLIYIQALRAIGIKDMIVTDVDASKLAIARRLGASMALDPTKEDVVTAVKGATNGLGATAVIDAAGSPQSLASTFSLVQDTGTIVVFGVPPESLQLPVKLYDIYRRELSIVGSFTNPYTNEQALNLLATGRIAFDEIITHPISLGEVEATMIKMRDRTETVVKAQITP